MGDRRRGGAEGFLGSMREEQKTLPVSATPSLIGEPRCLLNLPASLPSVLFLGVEHR